MDLISTAEPVWHEGEVRLQRSVGAAERLAESGPRAIRSWMPDQHRAFYAQLPFIVLGAVDDDGQAWATVTTGRPGFVRADDARHLTIDGGIDIEDPAAAGIGVGRPIALIGIDLATRRRNRANGTLTRADAGGLTVEVEHAFGNCPQYIQRRDWERVEQGACAPVAVRLDHLDDAARQLIDAADTLFVASYADLPDGARQVDVSHRGGKPGFVRIEDDGSLVIPDFAGNQYFNTLGNVLANGRAGLLFVDFTSGEILQVTGQAEVLLDDPRIAAFEGAERLWTVRPEQVVRRPAALGLHFRLQDQGFSPNALRTGSWPEAEARLAAPALGRSWRPFRISRVEEESTSVRSLYLEPADGTDLVRHRAGQHLPIRVGGIDDGTTTQRTYTISSAPADPFYRLSVKRQGRVSEHLHALRVGDVIEARAPAGGFTIEADERRPAVLLAAGIGITPLLSMLHHIVGEGRRTRRTRPTFLFYAARTAAERAFDDELRDLATAAGGAVRIVHVLSDVTAGGEYDAVGRIDMDLLRAALPFDAYDFYLCGPGGFMQSLYDDLRDLDVPDDRIHAEAFGPAALQRRRETPPAADAPMPAAETVRVVFAGAEKEARWTPAAGTLLDLAEASGLQPEFGCRGGSCGSCRTKVLEGRVAHEQTPTADVGADEVLICSAVPAAGPADRALVLDL